MMWVHRCPLHEERRRNVERCGNGKNNFSTKIGCK
jgi:hypothetical protein